MKRKKNGKIVTVDDLLKTAEVKEAEIPELGIVIRYAPLTLGDLKDLRKAVEDEEATTIILYRMLSKADPSVTLDKVKQLPLDVASIILNKISKINQLKGE